MLNTNNFVAALTLAILCSAPASAAVVWNEAVNGDLSNNPLAPTAVTFAPGPNDVVGQAGTAIGSSPGFDQDFFTFMVPPGYSLVSLIAVNVALSNPSDDVAFIALQSGSQITVNVDPPYTDATGLLGWRHVAPGDDGTNILPAMGTADFGASGFTGLLGAGPYSVWIQDDLPVDYDFRFVVAPEPGTTLLVLTGLALLAGVRWRRRLT